MYALVAKLVAVPQEVKPLTQKFTDLIPNELEKELPPLRGIQDAIDLAKSTYIPDESC